MDTAQLTFFMSAAVLGGAAMQFPLGRLSDHFDRRLIVIGSAVCGAGFSIALGLIPALTDALRIGLAFFWGGTTMTLYAICLAHANDRAKPEDFVMVGTSILLTFGLASAIGAPLGSLAMAWLGAGGLFLFAGLVLLLLALGVMRRRRTHYLPVVDETVPFLPMSFTTPAALEMDPRMDAEAIPQPEEHVETEPDPVGEAPADPPR